jgi:hypothetical protein
LTRLLRLADLSPAVQTHILGLPPAVGRGPITERRLRPIARISDHREQERQFKALLRQPVRAPKALVPAGSPLQNQPSAHIGACCAGGIEGIVQA